MKLSGKVPQICLLFGPSAAGGAYIPAFCDIVIMVEGNASMYLGSPRMAEMVIGEKVTLEEMGGARMHCSVSGCGDVLVKRKKKRSPLRVNICRTFQLILVKNRRWRNRESQRRLTKRLKNSFRKSKCPVQYVRFNRPCDR